MEDTYSLESVAVRYDYSDDSEDCGMGGPIFNAVIYYLFLVAVQEVLCQIIGCCISTHSPTDRELKKPITIGKGSSSNGKHIWSSQSRCGEPLTVSTPDGTIG